ncbi:hypothetical protein [Streptomyces sp. WELS2]|uniref:hypothetical protein n=1 Tax=Streptomyces sp. WELS2 TaxID=2749435 RepID=UPI0015F082D4|nr:hypothetical protein [Streptomyces sp. WELS2]
MSRGARKWTALGGIVSVLGAACLAGRWWAGESWSTVIAMSCLEVLLLAAVVGTRRARRER